jgi:hypothetical protein
MRKLTVIIIILFVIAPMPGKTAEGKKIQTGKPGIGVNTDRFGKIPLYFIPNQGQFSGEAEFFAKTSGYALWLTKTGLVFDSIRQTRLDETWHSSAGYEREVTRLQFLNANPAPEIRALKRTDYKVHYFSGNDASGWVTGLKASEAVIYEDLYPGIDLEVYGKNDDIEYDWIITPGADPAQIRFQIQGSGHVNIDADGNIVMGISFGDIKHRKPYAYQKIDGKTIPVAVNFLETADQVFGFEIFRYNPDFDLTIDPLVELVYSTYLGGSVYSDVGYGIAVDQAGCAGFNRICVQSGFASIYSV